MKYFNPKINQKHFDFGGCMGKMPTQAEFIRYNISRKQIINLEIFLHDAYNSIARSDHKNILLNNFKHTPQYFYILYANNNFKPIIGSIIASNDIIGRHYPFLIFRMLENPIAYEFQSIIPILYQDFFLQSEMICKQNWLAGQTDELINSIKPLQESQRYTRGESLEIVLAQLKALTLNDFINEMQFSKANIDIHQFLQTAIIVINRVNANINYQPPFGIRIPIPDIPNPCVYIVFWLQLIDALIKINNKRLQVFWHKSSRNHPSSLTVYLDTIPTDYFIRFININYNYDNLLDISKELNQNIIVSSEIVNLTRKRNISLLELFQNLSVLKNL